MNVPSKLLPMLITVALCAGGTGAAFSQTWMPWTDQQLKDPAELAKTLQDPSAPKPAIFNVGPIEQIKGAIQVGPASTQENLAALKRQLAKLPKDKEVVIYCGCCPFSRCPNVRPAFELLKEMKFKNAKLLNTPTNLKVDWISKGYPME